LHSLFPFFLIKPVPSPKVPAFLCLAVTIFTFRQ
jgi:hypothetical protein